MNFQVLFLMTPAASSFVAAACCLNSRSENGADLIHFFCIGLWVQMRIRWSTKHGHFWWPDYGMTLETSSHSLIIFPPFLSFLPSFPYHFPFPCLVVPLWSCQHQTFPYKVFRHSVELNIVLFLLALLITHDQSHFYWQCHVMKICLQRIRRWWNASQVSACWFYLEMNQLFKTQLWKSVFYPHRPIEVWNEISWKNTGNISLCIFLMKAARKKTRQWFRLLGLQQ